MTAHLIAAGPAQLSGLAAQADTQTLITVHDSANVDDPGPLMLVAHVPAGESSVSIYSTPTQLTRGALVVCSSPVRVSATLTYDLA